MQEILPPWPLLDDASIDARERIVRTAYDLFRRSGLAAVGVDRIVAEAGVAKTTLYRHFHSKDELIVAVLERHEDIWTRWLMQEAARRATPSTPAILAIFDALDDWYRQENFAGCLFINSLLETHDHTSHVREKSRTAIGNVHALLRRLSDDAGVRDPDAFAHQIQVLMRGSIVAAVGRHFEAVKQARAVAGLLLEQEASAGGEPSPAQGTQGPSRRTRRKR